MADIFRRRSIAFAGASGSSKKLRWNDVAKGFSETTNFSAIIGWHLYGVRIFKPHVVFEFNSGYDYLNVAYKFDVYSEVGDKISQCDLYAGKWDNFGVDLLLDEIVEGVRVWSRDQVTLSFSNKRSLNVYDHPMHRSWWFGGGSATLQGDLLNDVEYDDLSAAELLIRTHPLSAILDFART